jgi:ligand-binding SRPBCC domain-containing protein
MAIYGHLGVISVVDVQFYDKSSRGRRKIEILTRFHTFRGQQWIDRPLAEVFAFFSNAGNLEEITPPWLRFRVRSVSTPQIEAGTLIRYRLSLRGIPFGWTTQIRTWHPPHRFTDVQLSGPFALWHHTHRFEEKEGGTLISDIVRYRMPFGLIGRVVNVMQVGRDVERIFRFRRDRIGKIFQCRESPS